MANKNSPRLEGDGSKITQFLTKPRVFLALGLVVALAIPIGLFVNVRAQEFQAAEELRIAEELAAQEAQKELDETRRAEAEERERQKKALEAETLFVAFDSAFLGSFQPDCEAVSNSVKAPFVAELEKDAEKVANITDAREAARVMEGLEVPSQSVLSDYEQSVLGPLVTALEEAFSSSDRDDIAPPDQRERWQNEWVEHILVSCEVEAEFAAATRTISSATSQLQKTKTLASKVPWYPDGYQEYTAGLAWKWSTSEGSSPCRNCRYAKITVITRNGCPNGLYAEVNQLKGGTVINWTNDRIPSLRAGDRAVLNFVYYGAPSGTSSRLVELSCR